MWKQSSKTKSKQEPFASTQQAYDCALTLLSYKDYSEQKMFERLLEKGADKEQANEAIAKLKYYSFLDEQRYAQRVYEGWLMKRYYGRQHLQAELNKRAIKQEYVDEVMEQFTDDVEEEQAENAAALFLQRNRRKLEAVDCDYRKIYAAAGRFMAARGFSSRYMQTVVQKIKEVMIK